MDISLKRELVQEINKLPSKYKLVESKYKHFMVDNMPTEEELTEFYKNHYFNNEEDTLSRGMDIGNSDEKERFHFNRKYNEAISFLEEHFKDKEINILDVGCGHGIFLKHLYENGYSNLDGIEYDSSLNCSNINIFNGSFLDIDIEKKYDFISFNNVLEHVVSPELFLGKAKQLLNNKGCIRISVPNDLSMVQYNNFINKVEPNFSFFGPPAHLHYFDFKSMENLLQHNDFKTLYKTTDWSMETFILMGLDYTEDKKLGKACHQYRISFEYKMGEKFLDIYYRKMSELEMGRNVIIYAQI